MAQKAKVIKPKHSVGQTLMFLLKSLFKNVDILENEQPLWLALIIMVISLFSVVASGLAVNYRASANSILTTSNGDTCLDYGLQDFSYDIDNTNNTLKIENGSLTGTGIFTPQILSADGLTAINANATYTHIKSGESIVVFKVFVLDMDPIKTPQPERLNNFLNTSVLQRDTAANKNNWSPFSFMILTRSTVAFYTYVPGVDTARAAVQGYLSAWNNYDLHLIGHQVNSSKITDPIKIENNMVAFLDATYTPLKVALAWQNFGLQIGITGGIFLVAVLIFFLVSRGRNSLMNFSFIQSLKVVSFMSLTPGILAFALGWFLSNYVPFIYMLIMALRIMSAINKINGRSSSNNSEGPVYKARS